MLKNLSQSRVSDIYLVKAEGSSDTFLLKTNKIQRGVFNKLSTKKSMYREMDIVASFDHRNIARPSNVQVEGESISILYPYEEGNTLSQLCKRKSMFEDYEAINVVKQLCSALAYVHSKGIVHGDINPENVFITHDGVVKLLDFGLSMTDAEAKKIAEGEIVGTFPYLSPEQTGFTRFKVDSRSDVFCAVMILYRLLAGKLPFETQNDALKALLDSIVKRDVAAIKHVPQTLNEIVLKGLKPTPIDRYQTADGLLFDLEYCSQHIKGVAVTCIVTGQQDAKIAITRKRLFVERKKEIAMLAQGTAILQESLHASYLLYGMSGCGKTEVIREFRESVDEQSIAFVAVRCNRFTRSQPYSVLRQMVVDGIAQVAECSAQEQQNFRNALFQNLHKASGIICSIIPEIKSWFGSVLSVDEVEKSKEADRILHVLTELVSFLSSYKRSIFFIDDVQWIDRITLNVIQKTIEQKLPCMLLCTFRTVDEKEYINCFGRDLKQFGFTKFVSIKKFTKKDIQQLVQLRFGLIGNEQNLLDALLEKTGGIPFDLTEAICYLVNNSVLENNGGTWIFKGSESLPERFDPASLTIRRQSELTDDEMTYLKIASLIEGRIEFAVVKTVAHFAKDTSIAILDKLETAGFITSSVRGEHAFVHDRVKQSVASQIGSDEKKEIYAQLGALYEKMAIVDRQKMFNAAECYLKSNDILKAFGACIIAAGYATEKVAFDIAVRYYQKVLLIADIQPDICFRAHADIVDISIRFAEILMMTGANGQALTIFKKIVDLPELVQSKRLEVHYKIGTIHHNVGEFEKSTLCFIAILGELGLCMPKTKVGMAIVVAREALIQFVYSLGARRLLGKCKTDQKLFVVRILNKLSYTLYFNDMLLAFYVHFKAMNIADRLLDTAEKAETYALHMVPIYQLFLKKRSFKYLEKTNAINIRMQRKDALAFSQSFGGACYYYNANWLKALSTLKESNANYRAIGDIGGQLINWKHIFKTKVMQGKLTQKTIESMRTTIEISNRIHDRFYVVVAQSALNWLNLLKTGKNNTAEIAELNSKLASVGTSLFLVEAGYTMMCIDTLNGEFQQGYSRGKKLLSLSLKKCVNSEYQVGVFSQFCYILVSELRQRRNGSGSIAVSGKKIRVEFVFNALVHMLSCYSYPAYRGAFYRNIAWFLAIHGITPFAHWFFKRAVQVYHKLDMRYEEACSIRDYGQFLDTLCNLPGTARDSYEKAFELFSWCGAKLETDRLEPLLSREGIRMGERPAFGSDRDGLVLHGFGALPGVNMVRIDTLVDVSKSITETDDTGVLLRQILAAMITATGAEYGCLTINKLAYDDLEPIAMSFEGVEVPAGEVPVLKHIISKVIATHSLQCTTETEFDEEVETDAASIRSDLCVPLNWRDKHIGYVYLVNDRVRGLFGDGAQKAALILAAHAGILLENAYLMGKQKEYASDLQNQVTKQTRDIVFKNQQLEATNLKLIESERMKGILSGTLVHDIKNYAAGITGNLIYLSRRIGEDTKAHRILDVVCETCTDIASLASNLLDIAKMDDGKMVVRTEILDYQFFEGVAEKFGKSALYTEKNIVPTFIRPSVGFTILADVYLLERVLQNLYNNAAKYAPKGSTVELQLYADQDELIVCFYNSGTPIPDAEKEVLFEKYARIDSRQSPYSKGLGLFFCRMVMHAHQGRIWLDTDASGNYFKMAFSRHDTTSSFAVAS